jgi:hypothetical protein
MSAGEGLYAIAAPRREARFAMAMPTMCGTCGESCPAHRFRGPLSHIGTSLDRTRVTPGSDDGHSASHAAPGPARRPKLLEQLRTALRSRHYSDRTEKAYVMWTRRFVHFHGMRHPNELGELEVNAFLTHLAETRNVSASTQNQALSAPPVSPSARPGPRARRSRTRGAGPEAAHPHPLAIARSLSPGRNSPVAGDHQCASFPPEIA